MISILQRLNSLSIDVVIGALSMGYLACNVTHTNPPHIWWFSLAGSVWCVYTIDHLIDGYSNQFVISYRHEFHRRNSVKILLITLIVAVLTIIGTFIWMPLKFLIPGLVIALVVGGYLILVSIFKKVFYAKEAIIAIVYGTAIWYVPLLLNYENGGNVTVWILYLCTILTAWNNLLLFSYFGKSEDTIAGFTSIATKVKGVPFQILTYASILIVFVLLLLGYERSNMYAFIVFMMINLVYGCMLYFQHYFLKRDYYRLVGDGVFVLPLLLLFV